MQNEFSNWDGSNVYTWHRNHDSPGGEEPIGQERTLVRDPSTGAVVGGGVLQQGDDGPMQIVLTGKIWHLQQYTRMWEFFELSRTETILFRDFTGAEYQVLFTSFKPKRVGLLHNKHDPQMSNYRFDYTLTLEIIAIHSGPLYGIINQFGA